MIEDEIEKKETSMKKQVLKLSNQLEEYKSELRDKNKLDEVLKEKESIIKFL